MSANGVYEAIKTFLPDWPEWALDVLLVMTLLLVVISIATQFFYTQDDATTEGRKTQSDDNDDSLKKEFEGFRRKYITVYLVIMLADWMQGTHMYTFTCHTTLTFLRFSLQDS